MKLPFFASFKTFQGLLLSQSRSSKWISLTTCHFTILVRRGIVVPFMYVISNCKAYRFLGGLMLLGNGRGNSQPIIIFKTSVNPKIV